VIKLEKSKVIDRIIERLQAEMDAQAQAAQAAHEAATHEESRAEDQHDTRGLEASYLAGAQAGRVAELQEQISVYRQMTVKDFGPDDPVAPGALIELQLEDGPKRPSFYFLALQGGGSTVVVDGVSIQVVTPGAPMGEALLGKQAGDSFEIEARGMTRDYQVVSVS
jgi:transcription elongation GreA/GreB family factor